MTDRVEEIRRQVGYWIKCAAYNQPLMGVEWERSENQRWLDVADKIIEFCAAAIARAEREREDSRITLAQSERELAALKGLYEGLRQRLAQAEREWDQEKALRVKAIDRLDEVLTEVERLKKNSRFAEGTLKTEQRLYDEARADLARVRSALDREHICVMEACCNNAVRAALEGR